MIVESGDNRSTPPCPGAGMDCTFDNLTPGQSYTITLTGGLSFTGASSGTSDLPNGVLLARTQATFTAPTASVTLVLGVVVSNDEVSIVTNLTGAERVSISLLSGRTSGQAGPLKFTAYESTLPPTCVILNPRVPSCPVCAMDVSQCPEAAVIHGSQFCMGQHIFLCCLECPGSNLPLPAA